MTVSSVDTAELTRAFDVAPPAADHPVIAPPAGAAVLAPPAPPTEAPPTPACRAELRTERRAARRQRRLLASAGLVVLAGALGGTVAVLDVLH